MSDVVIRLDQVSKDFPATPGRKSVKEILGSPLRAARGQRAVDTVLRDIDLRVEKGDCLGVIGRNGAGKSTLLALMLGVSLPTRGSVSVSGRCTPLLELGAGFHPDLTGLENIMLNGILMGLPKRDVASRLEGIIDFSELRESIHKPIRTYSAGMQIRLAFAVAVHTDPEILLIDEVLAVGDTEFQVKSRNALTRLVRSGVSTVLVSHDLDEVEQLADRVVWIDQGRIRADGAPGEILAQYLRECEGQGTEEGRQDHA